MSEILAPAKTYELNIMASALGRLAIPNLDLHSIEQVSELLESSLSKLEINTPAVPIIDHVLIDQALIFDEKLQRQIKYGPSKDLLSANLIDKISKTITTHQDETRLMSLEKAGIIVKADEIAKGFGIPNLWHNANDLVEAELTKWGKDRSHPSVPESLLKTATTDETKSLIRFVHRDILGFEKDLNADVYLIDDPVNYHLFWAPKYKCLDYATPSTYKREDQLSFDLPHNVSHLAHLAALGENIDIKSYGDNMQERSFFEAVAVLSEEILINKFEENPDYARELATIMDTESDGLDANQLRQWVIDDRKFEFKLRTARLLADILLVDGCSFGETTQLISKKLGISHDYAEAEAKKYLPWTGLGAVYTSGYLALKNQGIKNVQDAIYSKSGKVNKTWANLI